MISETDGAGSVLRRYVHGPGMDEPLVWYEGSGLTDRRWLLADERGSIVAVTNGSGTVTNVNTYDAYGQPGVGNVGRFQYTGQMWLAEAGVYHYKARAYHPEFGRFLQTDPIGYAGGMNLYRYVRNDPVNRVDPWGLEDECEGEDDKGPECETETITVWGTRYQYPRASGLKLFFGGLLGSPAAAQDAADSCSSDAETFEGRVQDAGDLLRGAGYLDDTPMVHNRSYGLYRETLDEFGQIRGHILPVTVPPITNEALGGYDNSTDTITIYKGADESRPASFSTAFDSHGNPTTITSIRLSPFESIVLVGLHETGHSELGLAHNSDPYLDESENRAKRLFRTLCGRP